MLPASQWGARGEHQRGLKLKAAPNVYCTHTLPPEKISGEGFRSWAEKCRFLSRYALLSPSVFV